jgi:hypothetical protein
MSSKNNRTAATVVVGAVVVGTVVVAGTAAASWWMYQSIQQYGWEGTLRLIWEGDPYSPDVREAIDKLDGAERSIEKQEKILNTLETSLQRACLDSVDDGIVVAEWIVVYTTATGQDLYNDLVRIDNDLDKLAASVDSVLSSSVDDIKKRKKLLSKQIVAMMERADYLLQSYSGERR